MSSKHTPGPWKIIHGGFVSDDGFSVGSDNAAAQRVKVVCECWPCTIVDQQHREELLANARLIAAAPLMLGELKKVAEVYDFMRAELISYNDPFANDMSQPESDIRAAIRAAEGGE